MCPGGRWIIDTAYVDERVKIFCWDVTQVSDTEDDIAVLHPVAQIQSDIKCRLPGPAFLEIQSDYNGRCDML